MELRHFRYFVAVAEELHFTRAAARLHIAQPPLSQQIRQLERELGVTLFVRASSGVRLSDEGIVFLEHARRVLAAVDDATRAAQDAGRGEVGRLVIGFAGSVAIEILSDAVAAHRRRFPGVEMVLRELGSSAQVNGLLDGSLHVALLRERVSDPRIAFEVLRREPLVLVLPAGHRLSARASVRIADLKSEDFVLAPGDQSSSYTDVVLRLCARSGFIPRVAQEASEAVTVLGLVAAGMGVSLLPQSVTGMQTKGVVYRPLRTRAATIETAVAWRRDPASALVTSFVDTCRSTTVAG